VTLDAFWIDRTEVTNAQYAKCVSARQCDAPSETKSYTRDFYYGNGRYDDYPVIYVSWNDADKYCRWAGGQLPTEAQWEYSARGPNAYTYPWGNLFEGTRVNFCDKNCFDSWADKAVDDGYADTAPVGSYPTGAGWVGALDLSGNVWEWVSDWSGSYSDSSQTNPTGPTSGDYRGVRGGSWRSDAGDVRTAVRLSTPDLRVVATGFRCVVSPGG
jgi:serine/threonine-protein kinase